LKSVVKIYRDVVGVGFVLSDLEDKMSDEEFHKMDLIPLEIKSERDDDEEALLEFLQDEEENTTNKRKSNAVIEVDEDGDATTSAAPKRKKRLSKHGKKAWRKNIDDSKALEAITTSKWKMESEFGSDLFRVDNRKSQKATKNMTKGKFADHSLLSSPYIDRSLVSLSFHSHLFRGTKEVFQREVVGTRWSQERSQPL